MFNTINSKKNALRLAKKLLLFFLGQRVNNMNKVILNHFYLKDSFFGYFVYNKAQKIYQFGYDAEADKPNYSLSNFKSEEEFGQWLKEFYPSAR